MNELRWPRHALVRPVVLTALVAAACSTPSSDSTPSGDDELLPLTLENIYSDRGSALGVAVSPDGTALAVTGRGPEGPGIYRMDLGGNGQRWVRGGSPAWSPDGSRLAFLSGGALHVVGVASDQASTVVDGLPGLRNPSWAPDGHRIAFYSTQGGYQDIWVVAADGSDPPRQLTHGAASEDDPRFSPSWSPDGTQIAYVSNAADWWHDDVWVVDLSTGDSRKVSSSLMASSTPMWSPDGGSLALMGTAKDEYWYEDLSYLYVVDPADGGERIVDMQVYATDYIMRHEIAWSGDGRWIYFPYHERGAFDLWAVPAEGGVATRVTNVGGSWNAVDASADASVFAFVRSAPTEGQEVWTVKASGGPATRVTDFSPRFTGVQRPLEVSYRSFDGLYIQAFLYVPPALRGVAERGSVGAEASERYAGPVCPALVQVHGGGTNSYMQGQNLIEQYLAARGYVVLAINYRGGSGFGRSFQDLSVEDWLNGQARDPGAAADWLRAQPWVNDKVGIYGGSYGGMQSMSAITRTPDKFDAAVPMRGIYSEALTLPGADRLGKIFTITGHGGTPEERPEIYEKTNTLDRMDRITAPVLVMHGERDVRAPFQNFELAVERLSELGKEFESMSYPEGHGFRDPANSIDMYARLDAFFRKHLGECSN